MQDTTTPFSLGSWVRKQRSLWQQGSLSQDRVQILSALGFELGSETQITEEWEFRFDQLQECLLHVVSYLSSSVFTAQSRLSTCPCQNSAGPAKATSKACLKDQKSKLSTQ